MKPTLQKITTTLRGLTALSLGLTMASCVSDSNRSTLPLADSSPQHNYGVLVMAHGGGQNWNNAVEASLDSLRTDYPLEIAFGMADAGSLEASVRQLEARGVEHVGVVRLFVSGESWYERTLQILGLKEGAPERSSQHEHTDHTQMPMGFWKIDTDIAFHVSKEGLAEAEEMDAILLDRVQALSTDPQSEVVAIIAHGPGDDAENARWIAEIEERTALLRDELNVHDVRVFTLREDWEEKRAGAEELIRDYLLTVTDSGLKTIVVPYRVQGFGPYADVLSGLPYSADHLGLAPHDNVALWIRNQAEALRQQANL